MGKYQFSYEEKITIIREHEENHKTLKAICEEYDISKSYLCYILRDYRQKGKESLKNTKYYSAEYKLKVIKRHFEDGISVADLTRETGIQYRMLKHVATLRGLQVLYQIGVRLSVFGHSQTKSFSVSLFFKTA